MTGTKKQLAVLAVLSGLLSAREGHAVSGFSFEADLAQPDLRWLEDLPRSIHQPLQIVTTNHPDFSSSQQVLDLLRNSGLHPFIETRLRSRNRALQLNATGQRESLEFWFGGIRIRGFSVVSGNIKGRQIFVTGNLPAVDQSQAELALQDLGSWPDLSQSLSVARDYLQPGNPEADGSSGSSVTGEKVFFAAGDRLIPAWNFELKIKGLPYEVISNDREIFGFNPKYFDATEASAQVYETNKSDGKIGDLWFEITSGQQKLQNSYLKTELDYPNESRATASVENTFNFDQDSKQFREANVFAHAASHVDYLIANGYQWNGSTSITLRVAECYGSSCSCVPGKSCGDKSNAVYLPWDDLFDSPSIRIGEGDGITLKDLHFDSGVVRHEFGHHVVFSAITSYSKGSESLQLHEGLADFFVMMHADNPCLGGGICTDQPVGSCYVQQCLRTAENDLTYGSPDFRSALDHQKGQLISGFLWDLKMAGLERSELVRIVLGAIDLLPDTASFGDFTGALLTSEQLLTNGTHQSLIEQKMIARGLDTAAKSATASQSVSSRSSKSSNVFGCTMRAVAAELPVETANGSLSAIDDQKGNPMQMGIFVHDSPGIPTTSTKPFKFDVFLWLLLFAPLLAGLRLIKLPGSRARRQG